MDRIKLFGMLAGAAAAALTASPVCAQTDVKFALDWKFEGPSAPYFVAIDKGYYKAEGLEVTVDPAKVGPNQLHLYLFDRKSGAPFEATKELRVTAALPSAGGMIIQVSLALLKAANAFDDLVGSSLDPGRAAAAVQRLRLDTASEYDPATVEALSRVVNRRSLLL